MLTGEIRGQIDRIWDSFWTGGISNPLEVIEQITYLLFIRRLDDLHTLAERKAARLKRPMARRIFPEGTDPRGRPYDDLTSSTSARTWSSSAPILQLSRATSPKACRPNCSGSGWR